MSDIKADDIEVGDLLEEKDSLRAIARVERINTGPYGLAAYMRSLNQAAVSNFGLVFLLTAPQRWRKLTIVERVGYEELEAGRKWINVGDRVLCTCGHYAGMTGVVEEIIQDGLNVSFPIGGPHRRQKYTGTRTALVSLPFSSVEPLPLVEQIAGLADEGEDTE